MKNNIEKIRLSNLEVFLHLCRLKNFSETAKTLGKTQGSISQSLKEMEEILGTNLIERSSKKFRITEDGQLFFEFAKQVLEQTQQVVDTLNQRHGFVHPTIKIAASSIPGEYILPSLFMEFRKENSNVAFKLQVSNSREALQALKEATVSFSAVGNIDFIDLSEMNYIEIGQDEIHIICRVKHPIIKELAGIEDNNKDALVQKLSKYPWIFREKGSATRQTFFQQVSFAPKLTIGLEFYDNIAIINAIKNSDALTAISNNLYKTFCAKQEFQIINHPQIPLITRKFYFLKHKTCASTVYEQDFWQFMQKQKL